MQLIFISGSLRRSSLQVAGLTGFCNTFTQTFVPFRQLDSSLTNISNSLVKLKNQSVTFANGFATFSHESIKTTSIIFVQLVSQNGRGNLAMTIDIDEIVNNGSLVLKAYDADSNKNYSGTILFNILICN